MEGVEAMGSGASLGGMIWRRFRKIDGEN